ncbi:MAG: signal recognition particle receptor subunit alpha, partial [Candidatus Bathyarchaeia archaeon]
MFERLKEGLGRFVEKVSKTELRTEKVKPIVEELKFSLVESNVAISVAEGICTEVETRLQGMRVGMFEDRYRIIKDELKNAILSVLDIGEDRDFLSLIKEKNSAGEPFTVVFMGINGTGKTTSIAKTAYSLNH